MNRLAIGLLAAGAALAAASAPAATAETLTVCLEQDAPPFSYHHGGEAGGFDLAMSRAVAARLGRTLKVEWFRVGKLPDEDDPDPSQAENALLAAGKCQLIGGFPLIREELEPRSDVSRLPDFAGETPAERKLRVPIGKLRASRPYRFYPFTVLLSAKAAGRKIGSLGDLAGLKIGSETGTLADAMLMWYDHRRLVTQIVHYAPVKEIGHGGGLLDHLERGDIDATLVELRRYDLYRAAHPASHIVASGYYYPIGFNMGFAAAGNAARLVSDVDKAIAALIAQNAPQAMAKTAGMSYVAPRPPDIAHGVTLGELIAGSQ